ncbi:hypothetical protein AVEN_110976-1 [Araneus ventricosus]|uniref:Uncharacterized protein n=1 Tax=Araneus ventricosus TaxID=182803 RepID=A0A4Y2W8R2_ARAVE|nr:hypothetical protein AVEN_110976-1 [Araneus ventricosus]
MNAKRLKGEQWIKVIIDSGSDSDEENEYNLAFRKRRKHSPAGILRTSEYEETEEPEIRIHTPSGINDFQEAWSKNS